MRITGTHVVLTTIILLVVLDAGRSIYARVGYDKPVEVWQPSPAVYADLTWPPGAGVTSAAPGAQVYARRCAVCHGPDGRGNGPAAPSMIPRPRDFTLGLFKYKSTMPGQPPTDQDLERIVADGLPASTMPYFHDLLTPAEIHAVVAYIKQLSHAFDGAPPQPIVIPAANPKLISAERGRSLYLANGCVGCHGTDGRKGGYLEDAKNYPTPVRDLTAPWTFRGGSEPNQVWLRLTTGLHGASMPSFAYALTADERWDVVAYMQSLARTAPWEAGGQLQGLGHQPDLVRRGEYLVHAEMCGLCHTQVNRTGIYRSDDFYLAGGIRVVAYPHAVFVTRNLTSDSETGLGGWTEEQIVNALRNGRAPDRVLNLWGMPWFYFHYLQDDDAIALARYLKTLHPVKNRIPPALHYGVVETTASKLTRSLPVAMVTKITFADGNFGSGASNVRRDLPQQVLIVGQYVVLGLGVLLLVIVAVRDGRLRTARQRLKGFVAAVAVVALGIIVWVLYGLPALSVIPPDQIVAGATAGIPQPDPERITSPEQKALVERGLYLYKIASCAFCHNPNGAGGQKISWRPFGTLWTRNITSDAKTGIGEWTDPQIARAIRSGISAHGGTLHWQGMIWDHASNWDEEDVRALIAYLRILPPVVHEVPHARPPAPDDCAIYTVFIADSRVPGCKVK